MARSRLPDGIFHVTTCGVAERPIYADDFDRKHFVLLLERVAARFDWELYAWCQLSSGYHLVLESTAAALSRGMHALNGRYASEFNARYDRRGHVFGERFAARAIRDEAQLAGAIADVRDSPRRAGLCAFPRDWPWLSVAERLH